MPNPQQSILPDSYYSLRRVFSKGLTGRIDLDFPKIIRQGLFHFLVTGFIEKPVLSGLAGILLVKFETLEHSDMRLRDHGKRFQALVSLAHAHHELRRKTRQRQYLDKHVSPIGLTKEMMQFSPVAAIADHGINTGRQMITGNHIACRQECKARTEQQPATPHSHTYPCKLKPSPWSA